MKKILSLFIFLLLLAANSSAINVQTLSANARGGGWANRGSRQLWTSSTGHVYVIFMRGGVYTIGGRHSADNGATWDSTTNLFGSTSFSTSLPGTALKEDTLYVIGSRVGSSDTLVFLDKVTSMTVNLKDTVISGQRPVINGYAPAIGFDNDSLITIYRDTSNSNNRINALKSDGRIVASTVYSYRDSVTNSTHINNAVVTPVFNGVFEINGTGYGWFTRANGNGFDSIGQVITPTIEGGSFDNIGIATKSSNSDSSLYFAYEVADSIYFQAGKLRNQGGHPLVTYVSTRAPIRIADAAGVPKGNTLSRRRNACLTWASDYTALFCVYKKWADTTHPENPGIYYRLSKDEGSTWGAETLIDTLNADSCIYLMTPPVVYVNNVTRNAFVWAVWCARADATTNMRIVVDTINIPNVANITVRIGMLDNTILGRFARSYMWLPEEGITGNIKENR